MLDTLRWSGGNTSLDAIACGLPVVTLPGASCARGRARRCWRWSAFRARRARRGRLRSPSRRASRPIARGATRCRRGSTAAAARTLRRPGADRRARRGARSRSTGSALGRLAPERPARSALPRTRACSGRGRRAGARSRVREACGHRRESRPVVAKLDRAPHVLVARRRDQLRQAGGDHLARRRARCERRDRHMRAPARQRTARR